MIYKAHSVDTNKLLSLPETGMGYQIIEGKLYFSSERKKFIAYNGELIVDLDQEFLTYKSKLIKRSFSTLLSEANSWNIETSSISLVPRSFISETRYLSESKKNNKRRYTGGRGAIDNPIERADGKEKFVRISAYENDRRIDFENKKLIEGTYTTTQDDYLICIHSSDDPIDRYALPNDEEIKWAFYIQPKSYDSLQRGIVQPAFGHDGGGIEAYFEKGTSSNTYYSKKPYGQ